ncbi:MAG: hypothetical protein PWQ76_949 [Clostridiales bacterium]|nr:hypothetical protein [Oscillospiraceae bacterium]MDN5378694.1 hypothetical protein [Clostridiales bacterium]
MGTKNTKLNKYFLIALLAAIALAGSSCSDKKESSTAEVETASLEASTTSMQTPAQTEISTGTTIETTTAESTTVTTATTVVATQAPVVTTAKPVVTTVNTVATTQAPVVTTMATQPAVTTVAASQSSTAQGVPGKDVIWLNKDTCVPISQKLTLRFGGRDQTEMKTIYDAVYYLFYPQPGYTVSMWDVFRESAINDFNDVNCPAWQDINPNDEDSMSYALTFCSWLFDGHCGSNNGTSNASTILCAYSPNYNKQLSQGNCGTQVQCYRAVLNWWGFETRYIGGRAADGSNSRHAMIQIKRPNGKWYFTLSPWGSEDESGGGDNVIGYRVGGFIIDQIRD